MQAIVLGQQMSVSANQKIRISITIYSIYILG